MQENVSANNGSAQSGEVKRHLEHGYIVHESPEEKAKHEKLVQTLKALTDALRQAGDIVTNKETGRKVRQESKFINMVATVIAISNKYGVDSSELEKLGISETSDKYDRDYFEERKSHWAGQLQAQGSTRESMMHASNLDYVLSNLYSWGVGAMTSWHDSEGQEISLTSAYKGLDAAYRDLLEILESDAKPSATEPQTEYHI